MNKEQAIEIIERHIDNNIASGSLVEQALSMSIDALKAQLFQEGTTKDTTSDTISKTETVEHLRRMLEATVPNTDYDEGFIDGVEFGISTVSTMPIAQPERKRGEWVEISSINHTYKCSECGRLLVNVADGKNNVSKHYPYCHCGADMRGESE